MNRSNGYVLNGVARTVSNVSKILGAIFIVLFMVGSSFFVLITYAQDEPAVWTDKEEYRYGEPVLISGRGFLSFGTVTLTLTHSDFAEPRVFTVNTDSYGRFRFDQYLAESVKHAREPVIVTAYQDETHQATTSFWEPDLSLLAWNLRPNQRWEKGDIKGYNEGDSVPMRVDISGAAAGGSGKWIHFLVAIDYIDTNTGYYGFDGLTQMWDWTGEIPNPPFNIYTNNSSPFWVDPAEGVITSQGWVRNAFPTPGDQILEQVWEFNVTVYGDATVRFGAHLALTDLSIGKYGASYYSGSSLHVRVFDYTTNFAKINSGNMDVPFAINTILTPPEMNLEKSVTPQEVAEGMEMTFTVHFNNTGQADAQCINIWDVLDPVADIVPGSFLVWTDSNPPTPPINPPTLTDPQHWSWYIGSVRGTGQDSALPPLEYYLQFKAIVNTSEEGTYYNWVYLNYTDSHGGWFPELSAYAMFWIKGKPSIDITKSGPAYAHVNDTITYMIVVTNTGSTNLTDVDVVDDVLGVIASGLSLDKGESAFFNVTHLVTGSDPDPLVNFVNVTGHDKYDRWVNDSANHTVDILHPAIEVQKTATKSCAKIGETVWYTITVRNPSNDTDLYNVTVDDDLLNFHWSTDKFNAGEWEVFPLEAVANASMEDPFVNTVKAQGNDLLDLVVEDESNWTVDILHPQIKLEKGADLGCAAVGETVNYWVNVSNPSSDTVMYIYLNDTMFGQLYSGLLAPGTYLNFSYQYTVDVKDPTVIRNTATVTAVDRQGHYVNASAVWVLDVVHPDVTITKTANLPCAGIGDEVVYTINVTNPEWADVWLNGTIYDPMLGILQPFANLMPGDSIEIVSKYVVKTEDGEHGPLTNLAWVEAKDHQGHLKNVSSSVDVDVVHPDIVIEKTASLPCAAVGETVTYTITVTNPSWTDVWMNGTASDAMLNWSKEFQDLMPGNSVSWTVDYVVKDTDGLNGYLENIAEVVAYDHQRHMRTNASALVLVDVVHPDVIITKESDKKCAEPGESVLYWVNVTNPITADVWLNGTARDIETGSVWTFTNLRPGETANFTVSVPMPSGVNVYTNHAEVEAYDHQQHRLFRETSLTVDVVHPDIIVQKTVDKHCAQVGETVTYNITVTNPSRDVWMNGTVFDDMLGWKQTFVNLMPGQSTYWNVEYTIQPGDGLNGPLENTAKVEAYDHQLHLRTNESETVLVDVVHPDVVVTKFASMPCAGIGDVVVYTIIVTNPGWADVWINGTVHDEMLGLSEDFKNLTPGESKTWTKEYTVQKGDGINGPLENQAWVEAYDHQLHLRRNVSEVVMVDVVHPDIQIVKTVSAGSAHAGETIQFTISVTNPVSADVWLNGTIYDPLLELVWDFTNLVPGTTISKTFDYTIPANYTSTTLENIAWVEAKDHQNHTVMNRTSVEIEVLYPDIDVTKVGVEIAHEGDWVPYNVTVTNIGTTTLYNVTVYDSLVGLIGFFPVLEVGETVYINYTYQIPYGPGVVFNEVTASGQDKLDLWVSDDANWTVEKYNKITGYVYADLNKNRLNDSEPGLFNWVVVLVGVNESGPLMLTTNTDTFGYYEFLELTAGSYVVYEILEPDWYNISSRISSTIILASGDAGRFDMGNLPYVNITGFKWFDSDLDGQYDGTEARMAGWTIMLEGEDLLGHVSLTATTGDDGYYAFLMLLPGVYDITEVLKPGWLNITRLSRHVEVGELEPANITDQNFGNVKLGIIWGFKYLDENMNGYQDGEEKRLPGWTIELTGTLNDGSSFGPVYQVTDEHGEYNFSGLLPGVYHVREIMQEGWTHITPDHYDVTMVAGGYFHCGKFGNVQWGSIDGWKFIDWDMDGTMDTDEPGIPGWNVTLTGYLMNGRPPGSENGATRVGPITIQTDANGYWNFSYLLPGYYIVTEERRDLWYNVTPYEVGLWIINGTHVIDVKFGNVPLTCIWGYKFNDIDGDGIWDDNEPPLENWTITLEGYRADGVKVRIVMLTDPDGMFETCYNVLPGTYVLYEDLQDGWMNTTPAMYLIELNAPREPSKMERIFGNFELGRIYGSKFEDMDGDGVKDPEDLPLARWTIWIEGFGPNGIHVLTSTLTDENGSFEFTDLPPGTYSVWEVLQDGWYNTTPVKIDGIVVQSGDDLGAYLFLNTKYITIWGYKFEDANSNGIWDDGEEGIPRWTIYLYKDALPVPIAGLTGLDGKYVFSGLKPDYYLVVEASAEGWTPTNATWEELWAVSGTDHRVHDFGNFKDVRLCAFKFEDMDGDGEYEPWGEYPDRPIPGWSITFTGPGLGTGVTVLTNESGYACLIVHRAGTYNISEEDRAGWTHTTKPTTYVVDVLSGDDLGVFVFGNFHNVEITVFKYEDRNSNGVYDDGDRPLDNWTIEMWNVQTGYTMLNVTNLDGIAKFNLTMYGTWLVYEHLKDGWVKTQPTTDYYAFYVVSGDIIMGDDLEVYEFGNFHCVEILIFKYWDRSSSGNYEPRPGGVDEPLPGWYFTITRPDGTQFTDKTNETGYLSFMACMAGTYIITEEDRDGWSHIVPANGTSLVDVMSGDRTQIVMFGNYKHVLVTVFKYEDMNSDGIYDPQVDRPLGGWHFVLENFNGAPVYEGDTGDDGYLTFTVNRSGLYWLYEIVKPDWVPTNASLRAVDIISGIEVPIQEFGNFHKVKIIVFKFDDLNANGVYDGIPELDLKDVPLAGWNFTLWEKVGDTWVRIANATTNESGLAEFVVDHAGLYSVSEELKPGWILVWPPTGGWTFEVISGMEPLYWEFANFKMGTIYGWKFNDLDGDGEYDEDEPTMANWTITIEGRGPHGEMMLMVVKTNESGFYMVTGLPPGVWTVTETVKPGWVNTSEAIVHVIIWGHREANVSFFNFEKGSVEGSKYEDMNGDGILDAGDKPKANWTISLYIMTPQGLSLVAQTKTNETGQYEFTGLGPGTYVVVEEVRSGWYNTTPSWEVVYMKSGLDETIKPFLNTEYSKVWGYKFNDLNGNGVRDDGEPGVDGWTIYLWWDGNSTPETAITDANGYYEFRDLRPAVVLVYEQDKVGWTHTNETWEMFDVVSGTRRQLHDFANFENVRLCLFKFEDVNGNGVYDAGDRPLPDWNFTVTGPKGSVTVSTNETGWACLNLTAGGSYNVSEELPEGWINTTPSYKVVEVQSGIVLKPLKFGNFKLGQIVVKKFYDVDADGLDESHPGIGNWQITLMPLGITLNTADTGYVTFAGLGPGYYVVMEVQKPGWTSTTPPILVIGPMTSGVTLTADFGNVVFGNITGYKYYDKDLDGLRDEGEPGQFNWMVRLVGYTDWGLYVDRNTTTDSTGFYSFTEVQPGLYTVSEYLKSGWINTSRRVQDVDVSGLREEFNEVRNFGNIRYGIIEGYKFLDTYDEQYPYWPNGVFDYPEEHGLGNWRITLEGRTTGGQLVSEVRFTNNTDDLGHYEFTGLMPGMYWLNETMQAGFWATTSIARLILIYPDAHAQVIFREDFGNLLPAPDPELPFVLARGWNMWSSPLVTSAMYASDLAKAIGPNCVKITRLNTATGQYQSFVPGVTDPTSASNFQILYGVGYYIVVRGETFFTLVGELDASSSVSLVKGWNMVGYNQLAPMKASELVSHVSGAKVYKVTYLDSSTGKYYSYVPGVSTPDKDFTMTSGRAYFVVVGGPSTLTFGA